MPQLTGTVIDGKLQLDQKIDIPDNTRVTVSVSEGVWDPVKAREAVERLKKRTEENALSSGGLKFTREELYDRPSKYLQKMNRNDENQPDSKHGQSE